MAPAASPRRIAQRRAGVVAFALAGVAGVLASRERTLRYERLRFGRELDARREAEAKIRRQNAEIARLATERGQLVSQVAEAEQRTRMRIAERLHDDALQSLLAAHQELLEAAPGRAQVTRAHEVVGMAISRVREAVGSLHPVSLERGGLEHALRFHLAAAERRGGFEARLEISGTVSGDQDELLFGVARELVDNAALHSEATRVRLSLRRFGDEVLLEVLDDGIGIAPGRREEALREGHVGLASAAQRIETAAGSFELDTREEAGTLARARLPYLPIAPIAPIAPSGTAQSEAGADSEPESSTGGAGSAGSAGGASGSSPIDPDPPVPGSASPWSV